MTTPSVSVVMPVYNGEEYVREAIGSILEQSFSDLELVVIDDGSTDETPEILAEYAKHDHRLRIDRHERAGLGAALNRGVGLARAPLVARLDADDVAFPDRLERQRRFLDDHPSVVLVGGAVRFINHRGHGFADVTYPLSDDEIRMTMRKSTPFVHSAVMMRKEAFERSGGYRPAFRDAADVDLWLRLAELGTLANLPELLVCYRMHAGQATVQRRELMTMCAMAARVAAEERAAGRPDPVEAGRSIDRALLSDLGVDDRDFTAALVYDATWLARTMSRAGYDDTARELFAEATRLAHSRSGSRTLVGDVHRARARRYAEQGRGLRSRAAFARAALVSGTRSARHD